MSRRGRHLFTSESVTEGHPDKIADQISDSILDAILTQDPVSRVACETLVTTGLAIVAGEITTSAYVDFQEVVRSTIGEIGYNRGKFGFDAETPIAIRPNVPVGSPFVSFVHVFPASSVFQTALPGPPPLKQQLVRRR